MRAESIREVIDYVADRAGPAGLENVSADELAAAIANLTDTPLSVRVFELWIAPIRKQLAVTEATSGKRIGDLTMPELLSWAEVIGYAAATSFLGTSLLLAIFARPRR